MAEPTGLSIDYCARCGQITGHWPGCPAVECPRCHGEAVIERVATPDEVDAGCELGVAFDPCPDCRAHARLDP